MSGSRLRFSALALVVLATAACDRRPEAPAAAHSETPLPSVEELPEAAAADSQTDQAAAATPYEGPPKTVLVELFTSQGCNSCPAADAFIGELPGLGFDKDKVIPLTYHVTYWDDLGWQDPYATQLFDQRQISYAQLLPAAKAAEETTIKGPYTPQMVVDGRLHFSGSMKDVAQQEISKARNAPTLIAFDAKSSHGGGKMKVQIASRLEGEADAQLNTDRSKVGIFAALAQHEVKTEVPRGENAGKTLDEYWVVRDFEGPKLFRSSRENQTEFELDLPPDVDPTTLDVVIFFQDLAELKILATGIATRAS